ncbi:MAG: hypothetical protein KKH41_01435 [Candidatus Thermoplasmatota archaeon]|nr:hypothetical protein [Euryarchaeota archaeon]MBU4033077.1 hypothetical protein [Candidatus Thermoplasmatota archaeon]MBU4071989.1 hypothetical protein [Candidatus Thermoplasmatota archaeon]MBU4145294.1 hypothetical protein [Candidatus Thermoplasmatota archaeon]MBU4591224.1 hypothetical protein [Candidatus Thermoplasmatota archaeon]
MKKKDSRVFDYNIEMEFAFATVLGESVYNNAGLYDDPKYVKKDFLRWINSIEKRIIELTEYDERLLLLTTIHLDRIKENLKKISTEYVEWEIISDMIALISNLLGYDFLGEINHHAFFYQDKFQMEHTEREMSGRRVMEDWKWGDQNLQNYQVDIVMSLKEKGLTQFQISRIMNISQYKVKKLLKANTNVDETSSDTQ